MLCHWQCEEKSPVMAVLQNWIWNWRQNDRHVRHRKVNAVNLTLKKGLTWLQQRRDWITLSFLVFLCFSFTWLTVTVGSAPPMARRPAPTFMVYEPDFRLTPSCLRQGHDKQEKALKLKSQDSFYFHSVFVLYNRPPPSLSHYCHCHVTFMVWLSYIYKFHLK